MTNKERKELWLNYAKEVAKFAHALPDDDNEVVLEDEVTGGGFENPTPPLPPQPPH